MDPHFITFAGVRFSYHDVGWHTLYEKGGIRIEAEHAGWYANGGSAAVNKAYKVTRDGSVGNSSVVTLYEGGSGGGHFVFTTQSDPTGIVELRVVVMSGGEGALVTHRYNLYITTADTNGTEGLCFASAAPESNGDVFPTDPRVTREEAAAACGALETVEFDNCVTDVLMANSPSMAPVIASEFAGVEATIANLSLTPSPTSAPTPSPLPSPNLTCALFIELALVLDVSGSMRSDLAGLKLFANSIIDQFELGETMVRVSVTSFERSARVRTPLTTDRAALTAVIDNLDAGGRTSISAGITTAYGTLDASLARPGADLVMLVLTDGEQTEPGDPFAAAQAVKDAGAVLFAVGFGGASESTLERLASAPASTFALVTADLSALQSYFATSKRFCELVHDAVPTAAPTLAPTPAPSSTPTVAPSAQPTASPTSAPTVGPTPAPRTGPTPAPSTIPTGEPTAALSSAAPSKAIIDN